MTAYADSSTSTATRSLYIHFGTVSCCPCCCAWECLENKVSNAGNLLSAVNLFSSGKWSSNGSRGVCHIPPIVTVSDRFRWKCIPRVFKLKWGQQCFSKDRLLKMPDTTLYNKQTISVSSWCNSGFYTSLKVMLRLIRHSFAWSTVQNIFFGLMNKDLLSQTNCFSCLWALSRDWLPLTNQRFEQEVSYLLSATSYRVASTKTLCVMYADLIFGISSASIFLKCQ